MASSAATPHPLRQPAPPTEDGNEALRQLITERADRLASGEDKGIPHDEFWDGVWEDFKEDHGKYPDEFEDDE